MAKKQKGKMSLVLYSGEKVEVLSMQGNYYICEGRQFRLNSPQIAAVDFEPVEEVKQPSKKKKPAKGKSEG